MYRKPLRAAAVVVFVGLLFPLAYERLTRPGALEHAGEPEHVPPAPEWGAERPYELHMRRGREIVDAPHGLLQLARSYPAFADKGPVIGGRRITIMADKTVCRVGETVWVIHCLEALDPSVWLAVMGPKAVYNEFVDGENRSPSFGGGDYMGGVVRGLGVDFNYDPTGYTFPAPGQYRIEWRGGDSAEESVGLRSNVLTICVRE